MPAIGRIRLIALRAPSPQPVATAFGAMDSRPALFVRIEDRDGAVGWGEIWCNFPRHGLESRFHLAADHLGPRYLGREVADPPALARAATEAVRRLAIQSGERGAFANVVAGFDCALWDLLARRAGMPLARFLGGELRPLPAYASGIGPEDPPAQMEAARALGHRIFKLKLGFADDERNLRAAGAFLADGEILLADANQAWEVEEARRRLPALAAYHPGWIEEPVPADLPPAVFAELAAISPVPLAGGENLSSMTAFEETIAARALAVVQPDVAKWGGISFCREVAAKAMGAGLRYCPHFLGGGIGLLHSAHLLAAAGGDGWLEVDINPNPLREELLPFSGCDASGRIALDDGPGIGVDPDPALLAAYRVMETEIL